MLFALWVPRYAVSGPELDFHVSACNHVTTELSAQAAVCNSLHPQANYVTVQGPQHAVAHARKQDTYAQQGARNLAHWQMHI
jgi:hypothetical protein